MLKIRAVRLLVVYGIPVAIGIAVGFLIGVSLGTVHAEQSPCKCGTHL